MVLKCYVVLVEILLTSTEKCIGDLKLKIVEPTVHKSLGKSFVNILELT